MSHFNSLQCFGQRTNLVYLNQDRVSCTHLDTLLQELRVGYKQVVTNQLTTVANLLGQLHPVVPIVLIQTVLNRVDRIFCNQFFQVSNLLISGQLLTVRILWHATLQLTIVVEPLTVLLNSKLWSSAVHSNLHILAWLITCILDSLNDRIQGIFNTIELRSETTLITYSCRQAALLQQFCQSVEYFCTHTNAFFDRRSTHWTNHKLLESNRSIRVCATVDDVHHWNGQRISVDTTDITI